MPTFPELFKILFIGSHSVGKTCFIERFANAKFSSQAGQGIGIDFKMRAVIIDGLEFKLQLFDIAGQDSYATLPESYFKGANGIVIIFDLTDHSSFDQVKVWIEQMKSHSDQKVCKILLGNKCDLQENRVIDKHKIQELVKENKIPYFDVSAKTGENVETALFLLAKQIKRTSFLSKIVLVGAGPVGKTCLTHVLAHGEFPLKILPTTGVDFRNRVVLIEDLKIRFQVWDTPGHSTYHEITKNLFKSADGVLIVFDLTDQNSFDEVKVWIEHLKKNNDPKICKMILGNKCDLEEKRVIDKQTIRELVKVVRVPYFEVSAKTGENVEEALFNFARDIKRTFINDEKRVEIRND